MLQIDSNNNIILTRGDTLTLTVELTKDGEVYTPEEGDVIRFAVSNVYKTQFGYELLISKTIPNDTLTFTVSSAETQLDPEMQKFTSDRSLKCAQVIISCIPILSVYPFLQRYFVTGLVLGSVKG